MIFSSNPHLFIRTLADIILHTEQTSWETNIFFLILMTKIFFFLIIYNKNLLHEEQQQYLYFLLTPNDIL